MNQQLVESLVKAIESLPEDDYAMFQQQLASRTIQKSIGICGGQARIRNTRIPVWTIVSLQKQGADELELLRNYPSLTPFDLVATKIYYAMNSSEIDGILTRYSEEDNQELEGVIIEC